MKLTFKQIVASISPYQEITAIKFPPKLSLEIYKLGKELDKELTAYRDLNEKLYVAHKVPVGSDAGSYDLGQLSEKQLQAFLKDLEELLNLEVEVRNVEVPIEAIPQAISPATLGALEWLIKDDEDKEVAKTASTGE